MTPLGQAARVVKASCARRFHGNYQHNFKHTRPMHPQAKVKMRRTIGRSWNYTNDSASRHVGPMAQDFHAAFGVGTDDKHIATVDVDVVARAAIQGAESETRGRVKAQRYRECRIKRRLEALEKIVLSAKSN
jgi:hypothetical protein